MKKLFLVLFSCLLLASPMFVKAVSAEDSEIDISKYETKNFKEILKEEEIKEKFKSYSENDNQATIYLFRGSGCHFCQDFLNFLNSITDDYGKYFKVVGFEVWSNQENGNLMQKISSFMGSEASGVPFIIIGDQVFPGYASDYDDGIKTAIKSLYESSEKYDVFEEYNKAVKQAKKAAGGNTGTIVFFNALFTCIACVVVVLYNKKQNEKILDKIESLKKLEKNKEEKKNKNEKKK